MIEYEHFDRAEIRGRNDKSKSLPAIFQETYRYRNLRKKHTHN